MEEGEDCSVCGEERDPGSSPAFLPCLHPCCPQHLQPQTLHSPAPESSRRNSSQERGQPEEDAQANSEEELDSLQAKGDHSHLVFCQRCRRDVTLTPGGVTSAEIWRGLAAMMTTTSTTTSTTTLLPESSRRRVVELGRSARCCVDGKMADVWCRTCRAAICRACAQREHELHTVDGERSEEEEEEEEEEEGSLSDELAGVEDVEELLKQAGGWLDRQPALLEELEELEKFVGKTSVPRDTAVTDELFSESLARLLRTLQEEEQDVRAALDERRARLQTFSAEVGAAVAACRGAARASAAAAPARGGEEGGQPVVSALLVPPLRAALARGCQTEAERVGVLHPLPSLGVSLHVIWQVKVASTLKLNIRAMGVDRDSGEVILGDADSRKLLRYSSDGQLLSTHHIGCSPCSLAVGEEAVAVVASDGRLKLYDVGDLDNKMADVDIPGGTVGNNVPAPTSVAALQGCKFLVGNLSSNTLALFDGSGALLDRPRCLVQNPVISLFEVSAERWLLSSWRDNKVALVRPEDGVEIRSFKREVRGPHFHWQPNYAVALESGHVVVADFYFHEVVVFDPEGEVVFRDSVPGLDHPRNLAYCPAMGRLVVSNLEGKVVAFSLSF